MGGLMRNGVAFARARLFAFVVPLALLAGALGSQYLGGLYPCEMCHWQRWPYYAALPIAALAFAAPRPAARSLVTVAALLILTSGAIGLFHAGVEYRWWPGFTSCASTVADGPGDLLDRIMQAPMIRCDVPQWTLGGISLAGFNALVAIPTGLAILMSCLRRR